MKRAWPDVVMVKHSDRFTTGIADLHATRSNALTIWVELKYLPSIVKRVKSGLTDLQDTYLQAHADRGVPAYVLIGTDKNKSHMLYPIEEHDGYAYRKDVLTDAQLMKALKWTK
jgi:hypothetical protein